MHPRYKVIFFLHVSYVDRILNGALTPEVMDLGTHDYIGFLGIDADCTLVIPCISASAASNSP